MTTSEARLRTWRTPLIVIIAGCVIATVGFGIRSVFGLFLAPMTLDQGWSRETFALALAIQNLMWGIGMPVAGAIADRYGPRYVLTAGTIIYALGTWGMASAGSGVTLQLTAGVVVGTGIAFSSFSLVLAAMARTVGPDRRSLALGLGTAASSLGQVVFSPIGQGFISAYGWHMALLTLAALTLLIIPLAFVLPNATAAGGAPVTDQSLGEALTEARGHRGYLLLTTGFFVCGFHVSFIVVHFPAFVQDLGLAASVGAVSLSLIGAFNIFGSFGSGAFGQRWSKKRGLSGIYALRALTIALMLLAPKTDLTIYLFASVMGVLWLSTVPLTTGIVEQVFGVRYLATLFGIVFLSHQIGSFIGVWLGGYIYDQTGSYDPVWWVGVALGVTAAIIHMPIDERPVARVRTPTGRAHPGQQT